jgi:mitogen-activated protein kinase 15
MFAGDSTLNQLEKIIEYTGAVNHEDIESLDSPVADQLITQIKVKKKSFREYFSSVDPDFWVLLKGTLEFNPDKRMTIEEVLDLELFDEFREEIKQLKNSKSTIKLRIDDNVRFNLKVYR